MVCDTVCYQRIYSDQEGQLPILSIVTIIRVAPPGGG